MGDLLIKCLERAMRANASLEVDRSVLRGLIGTLNAAICTTKDVDLTRTTNDFLQKLAAEVKKCVKRSALNLFRNDSLRCLWSLIWSRLELEPVVAQMSKAYEGCGILRDYVLMLILRDHNSGRDNTGGTKRPVNIIDDDAVNRKVRHVLPPVLVKRYDDLAASCIRNAKTKLERLPEISSANEASKPELESALKLMYSPAVGASNGRCLVIKQEMYELLQLIDLHAQNSYNDVCGSAALKSLVSSLKTDSILIDRVSDILLDMGQKLRAVVVRDFVRLLVDSSAASIWKFVVEKRRLNEPSKGGVSFRTSLKIRNMKGL